MSNKLQGKNFGFTGAHACKPVNQNKSVGGSAPIIGRTSKPPVSAGPSFWETDIEVVNSCGVLDEKILVSMTPKARGKINMLMERFPSIEWLAYLVGNKETNTIEDIVIPKQRVTSVNVYVDGTVDVPIIGVIHSHHDMGNKFSHTDDTYINQNHDLSLCISKQGIEGQARVKTECGRFTMVPVTVIDRVVGFDAVEFLQEVDEKITEQSFVYNRVGGNAGYGHVGYGPMGNRIDEDFFGDYDDISNITTGKNKIALENRQVLEEVKSYQESIRISEVDAFYKVEFDMLINLIDSIGGPNFDYHVNKAFEHQDNVFTEDYYRLIDEISLWSDSFTNNELISLKGLSDLLKKRLEVENIH